MARIRTLKPEFWTDEKLALMTPLTRLVFLGLISQADDAGRLVDNVKLIDGLLFPYTDDTCAEALADLHRIGRIMRYRSESGQPLIQVVNWEKHQKVAHPSAYVLPSPPAVVVKPSCDSHEDLVKVSCSDPLPTTYDQRPATNAAREDETAAADSDPLAECVAFVEGHGYGPREVLIAQGEDATVWNDATGARVPPPDRLRLLKLAHARVQDKSSANLRSALRYVIPQQYHPFVAPLPDDLPSARGNQRAQPVNPAAAMPTVQEIEAKRKAEEERYNTWRQQMLFRLRAEPDGVREALDKEAAALIGDVLKSLPSTARARTLEAKALELYGRRIGEPQPVAA